MASATAAKKVLFLVGDYVEDYEVMVPFQALAAFGCSVEAVCPGKKAGDIVKTAIHDFEGDQTYTEKRGHNFSLNQSWPVAAEDYDALVIPGGRSPEYLSVDEGVLSLARAFVEAQKPVASICHGQLILAAAGLLRDKRATAYPALQPVLEAAGAQWIAPDPISACFVDGQLATGAAWPGHPEFIARLLQLMGATISGGAQDNNILMLVGDFVEDYEAMVPMQAMQALGYTVHAICPDKAKGDTCKTAVHDFEGDQTYTEKPGHNFALNFSFADVAGPDGYNMLVIPGGRAPEYLSVNAQVTALVRAFVDAGKPIAALCHGPLVLAAAGALQGRKCTAYPALKPIIEGAGAHWLAPEPISKCFTDGTLISGGAWPAHPDFIASIMQALGTTVVF